MVVHRVDFFVGVHQVDSVAVVLRVVENVIVDPAVLVGLVGLVVPVVAGHLVDVAVVVVVALIFVVAAVFFCYQLCPGFANLSVQPVQQIVFRFL